MTRHGERVGTDGAPRWLAPTAVLVVAVVTCGAMVVLLFGGASEDRPKNADRLAALPVERDGDKVITDAPDTVSEWLDRLRHGGAEPDDSPPKTSGLSVYLIDGSAEPRLHREVHRTEPDDKPVLVALTAAVGGETFDSDLVCPWPAGTRVNGVRQEADLVTVDLNEVAAGAGEGAADAAERQKLALQQLVWTARAADETVQRVQVTVGGKPATKLLGQPVAQSGDQVSPDPGVLAPLTLLRPVPSGTSQTRLNVLGDTVGDQVTWELAPLAGGRGLTGTAKASDTEQGVSFGPGRRVLRFTIDAPAAAAYRLTISGPAGSVVTRDVTVA